MEFTRFIVQPRIPTGSSPIFSMPSIRLRLGVALLAALATISLFRRTPSNPPAAASNVPLSQAVATASARAIADAEDSLAGRGETLGRLAYAQAWSGSLPPAMEAFRAWTERYRNAPSLAARLALEAEGVSLAQARRPEMRKMIVTDPRQALAVTVPAVVRQELPAAVLAQLETRHSGRGDYAMMAAAPEPGVPMDTPAQQRIVYLDGETFTARPYGRREQQLTKEGASLHGIALDGQFAVHESPVRVLEPGEKLAKAAVSPTRCATCALALEGAAGVEIANVAALEFAEADGNVWRVHEADMPTLERRALGAESLSGPRVSTFDPAAPDRAADAATSHTIGTKRVLVIRVDFSDFPGDPVSQTTAQNLFDSAIKSIMEDMSYGQTSLTTTVTSQLYRLSRTGASYASAADNTGLHADARSAAAANYTMADYDRIVVVFPRLTNATGSRINYGGLASVGGTNAWINGSPNFVFATITHELGHTYGLFHANLWRVRDGNPVSSSGTTLEYGDPFDMMGSTTATGVTRDTRHHFGPWGKNKLGWLPDAAVTTATQSGTYRIHRFDHRNSPRDKPLALRVYRDGVRWYWIGLRQSFATGTPTSAGAYVTWGYNQVLEGQLLDLTTPGTSANDAALAIGATFTDPLYGVSIKALARGGTAPEEWLDVEITMPAAPPSVVSAWGRLYAPFFDDETGDDVLPAPETNVPMDLVGVKAIAAGDQHAIALKADGTVVAWGDHVAGQIAVPAGLGTVVSVAAGGDFSGVVLADGTVRVWGATTAGVTTVPAGLNNVKQLALGRNHAVALKNDGTLVMWGSNSLGQTSAPPDLGEITMVAAGAEHTVALKRDGTVAAWGHSLVRTGVPAGLANVKSISAFGALTGGQFAVAVKTDGTVVAWGASNSGQTTVPADLNNVASVAAGAFHSVVLRNDGTVTTFGSTFSGANVVPRSMPKATAVAASSAGSFALNGSGFAIGTQPRSQLIALGASVTLRVDVIGTGVTYQWRKDGQNIPGATSATYTITGAGAASAGSYDVVVTSGPDRIISAAAVITVQTETEVSRISNLSIRTNAGTGADMLIVGFSVSGTGTKPLLVRAVGPTLAGFGVSGVLGDPKVDLYNSSQVRINGNDDWDDGDAALFQRLGAFALRADSLDAALSVPQLPTGTYSAQVTSFRAGLTGVVLAEIYDASEPITMTASRPRLVNVSARARSGTGNDILIAGFVIAGPTPKKVMIRAIGPTLTAFGVTGVLADPQLELFNSVPARIQSNDNWGGTAELAAAFRSVGAFNLEATTRDAALIATLPPGGYTAQISGVGSTTGVALVEIYELP